MRSDIDALAEGLLAALKETGYTLHHEYADGGVYDVAPALAATPPVAALLADAAVGRAVRRLGDSWWCDHTLPSSGVDIEYWDEGNVRHKGTGPDLPSAIEAALGDE